ncbi:12580_t:CDS:2, partial [Gigaspora margarita]
HAICIRKMKTAKYSKEEKELIIMEVSEYMRSAKDGFATRQFDPSRPYDQNGVSLEHI